MPGIIFISAFIVYLYICSCSQHRHTYTYICVDVFIYCIRRSYNKFTLNAHATNLNQLFTFVHISIKYSLVRKYIVATITPLTYGSKNFMSAASYDRHATIYLQIQFIYLFKFRYTFLIELLPLQFM